MSNEQVVDQMFRSFGFGRHQLSDDTAHIEVHGNRVLGAHLVPGLLVEPVERAEGIEARIAIEKGARLAKPVHVCFGLLPDRGVQHVELQIEVGADSAASILAHCTFPNAVAVRHTMNATIRVDRGAQYAYLERHVHGPQGGVLVLPKTKVTVDEGARFKTDFVLISGRVGRIEMNVDVDCQARAVAEVTARISGRGDDQIQIDEAAHLLGEEARAVLTSHIAVRDDAQAHVRNTLTAHAPYARGHVDCKEIVQGRAIATAVPIVDVRHAKAHVTHEAAIGSVDSKQLQTLMARGLTEEAAVELIIQGLLT